MPKRIRRCRFSQFFSSWVSIVSGANSRGSASRLVHFRRIVRKPPHRNAQHPDRRCRQQPQRPRNVRLPRAVQGQLPQGARPDLSVDGMVELARLNDVVYVGRPVFGQAQSQITLFRLMPDGKHAERVPVKLGRSSVNTIEILEGLKVGDQVVLSDMSAWDAHNRIRLN